jgi:hypothetical protein
MAVERERERGKKCRHNEERKMVWCFFACEEGEREKERF